MMELFIPLFSGILAAFTPCALVMIPLILYRFIGEKKELKPIALLASGFILTYILLAYILASLFDSSLQNGLKIGIALLFIVLGILAFFDRINPLNFPVIRDPFIFGVVLVPLVIFNPCVIPFSGFLITVSGPALLINMILFAAGLMIPSIAFAIFGTRFINKKYFHHVSRFMSLILVIAGVYVLLGITSITRLDIMIVSIFLMLIFFLMIKIFFIVNDREDIYSIPNLLLLISLVAIISIGIFHCSYQVQPVPMGACHAEVTSCTVCLQCIGVFAATLIIGSTAIFLRKWIT